MNATARVVRARRKIADAETEFRTAIREANASGVSYREIADALRGHGWETSTMTVHREAAR